MANKPSAVKSAAKAAPKNAGAVAEVKNDGALIIAGDMVGAADLAHIKRGQGRGNENVKADDLVIPRLEIVQALSPQVKRGDPKFNDQARGGMLFNTVTGRLYGDNTFLVPVHYSKMWLVWKKRKDSQGKSLEGGFLGAFTSPEEANDKMQAEIKGGLNPDHVEVIDTPQHLCLLVDAGAGGQGDVSEVMLSMPRTKAKKSREWNSMVKLAGGDRFSRVYRVGTVLEKGKLGDYYNYSLAPCGHPAKPLYDRAEKLYEAVSSGARTIKADMTDVDEVPGDGEGAEM